MKRLALCVLVAFCSVCIFGQQAPEEYVSAYLEGVDGCKSLSVTKDSGAVALYGTNGYVFSGFVSLELVDTIEKMNKKGQAIDDIVITEGGLWCVLGQNIVFGPGIPAGLKSCVQKYVNEGCSIKCVAVNDSGDWCVVSSGGWNCSSAWVRKVVNAAEVSQGSLKYMHIGNDRSIVAVCGKGVAFSGNVPKDMISKISSCGFAPAKAKFFYDGKWFVCGESGEYLAEY